MLTRLSVLIFLICFLTKGMSQSGQIFPPDSNNQLPVLLVFSGSDWCSNCIRFNREVLTDSVFLKYTRDKLSVYKADFPQRKKLTKETIQFNENLAEQYNSNGQFPYILLFDKDHKLVSGIPYSHQDSKTFIEQLDLLLPEKKQTEYKHRITAMGSFFEFIIVEGIGNEEKVSEYFAACEDEVDRIENLISEWIPTSEVSLINKNAGIEPLTVSEELFQLIERSIQMGDLTQRAFDITFQGLSVLWRFDGSMHQPPDSIKIVKTLQKIDYQKIQLLDSNKVWLPVKGMAIGFGGIGQGYAVDMIRQLLDKEGVENYVINSSGDIYAKGRKADGSKWKVGIADPVNKDKMIRWLEVDGKAVVTSGNYEKYFKYEGERYAHIINPKTGWPTKGILSTTVISQSTEISDALATALFVLGVEVGIHLVNQLPNTDCIIIDEENNVYYSRDLLINN